MKKPVRKRLLGRRLFSGGLCCGLFALFALLGLGGSFGGVGLGLGGGSLLGDLLWCGGSLLSGDRVNLGFGVGHCDGLLEVLAWRKAGRSSRVGASGTTAARRT